MRFAPPRRRRRSENIVPMINVVFLLLVFFLMTAEIAPPDPFEVIPPAAEAAQDAPRVAVLLIGADGAMALGEARDEAVFDALARLAPSTPVMIRADGRLAARTLAALLPRLAAMGLSELSLAVRPDAAGAR